MSNGKEEKEVHEEESDAEQEEDEENSMPQSIVQANAAAERLEKANKRLEGNLARLEAAQVEKALGGKADAGDATKPPEETPKEYKDKVMRGEV